MMKEKDDWKLFSIAWTVHRLPEEEREFDLNLFAHSYAQVWGSNRPEFVALFFEENGSLQVNDGNTAIGRDASPGGKGNKVKISGYELWQMETEGHIKNSKGYFSTEEYNKQLELERKN